jgi:RNA polymerase sigma-70 factor (ECF subfamily)
MPPAADEFAALMARARAGDGLAIAQLAQQYEPELRLAARVLLGPALRPYLDSMDLVQSVHKSLLLGLRRDQFDISSPEKLVALALTVVRHKVAHHWRHLQRQHRFENQSTESGGVTPLLSVPSGQDTDPAEAAQFHDAVEHLCRNLDATERRLVELRWQGCSTAEAAKELDVDPDVLRVRLSRLRQRLRATGVLADWL